MARVPAARIVGSMDGLGDWAAMEGQWRYVINTTTSYLVHCQTVCVGCHIVIFSVRIAQLSRVLLNNQTQALQPLQP